VDYNFIDDPELKSILEKKSKEGKTTKKSLRSSKTNDNKNSSSKDKFTEKEFSKRVNQNDRFQSLKLKSSKKVRKRIKKPSTKNLALATKQLASMLKTGLPLLEALNILSESTDDKSLRLVFKDAAISISRGSSFVSTLEKYPDVFDEMYLALVSAGETAGLLDQVLERESTLLESLSKIKGQIKSALAYPLAIFALTVIVVIIMLLFVIPVFQDMYSSSGADLPGLTQFMVDASKFLRDPVQILKLIPLFFILIFFTKILLKKESFHLWKDSLLLKLPLTKELITKSSLANFSRTLSALNSAGVPILESLLIAKRTIGNRIFKRIVNKMNEEIQYGQPLYKVLASEKVIPILFTSMFRIGEETGELSEMVNKLADFYEDEVETSVKGLTSLLEPLMIVFVSGVVAFILVAMYLPMFNMMNTVS
jgi:type IV pilus assembly protein PilC